MQTNIKINPQLLQEIAEKIKNKIIATLPQKETSGFLCETFLQGEPYLIQEGLIQSYPIERVIFALAGLFNLYKDDNFALKNQILYDLDNNNPCEFDGVIEQQNSANKTARILIKVSPKNFNQNDFDRYLLKYGWFCGSTSNLFGYDNLVCFVYEKKFDVEVSDFVQKQDFIYHICPNIYLNKINKSGLVPKYSSWNRFSNPERVYFFVKKPTHNDFVLWAKNFNIYKKVYAGNEGWSLLKIDVPSLIENTKFYFDPRMRDGVYTTGNIPPQSIEIIDYIENDK